ncbi:MAG: NAD(P)-dependent oxidoreductase [Candidatus Bathyarchaeia archaeon]|jgi:UDP-glucose 4-epimerase
MHRYRIGITGGSGFIGSSLAKHLSSSFDVKILDVKAPIEKTAGLVFELCDIRKYEEVAKALADCDLVIHAAIIQIPLINEDKRLGYEVNFLGTANICRTVEECPRVKGMILSGTWHTMGERGLSGVINEEIGFRPDKVEDRARLYVLSKMAQNAIVRFYSEMSDKIYGIIRMGTVLGEGMPEKTAANIFITRGLKGKSLTPYKNSAYRPMLYVDIDDVCQAYEKFARKILNGEFEKSQNSLSHIVNVYYPSPVTILELAGIVRDAIIKYSSGRVDPRIEVIDQGKPLLFNEEDKDKIKVDITKVSRLLGLEKLTSPKESIEKIVKNKLCSNNP